LGYFAYILLYRYPSKYIDKHFQEFFNQYLSISSLVPYIYDENQFLIIRNKLFPQPSIKEMQTAKRIAHLATNRVDQSNKFDKNFFLHFTHEKRLESLKRDIHKIYEEVFQDTEASDIRLIVGHRNSRNTTLELIDKQPRSSLIKLKPIKSKTKLIYK